MAGSIFCVGAINLKFGMSMGRNTQVFQVQIFHICSLKFGSLCILRLHDGNRAIIGQKWQKYRGVMDFGKFLTYDRE